MPGGQSLRSSQSNGQYGMRYPVVLCNNTRLKSQAGSGNHFCIQLVIWLFYLAGQVCFPADFLTLTK